MSDTKHTPGPWQVMPHHPDRVGGVTSIGVAERDIVLFHGVAKPHHPKSHANMRLIAAAPELLAALEEIMRWWDGDDGIEDQFINARQALEKAKGEKQ